LESRAANLKASKANATSFTLNVSGFALNVSGFTADAQGLQANVTSFTPDAEGLQANVTSLTGVVTSFAPDALNRVRLTILRFRNPQFNTTVASDRESQIASLTPFPFHRSGRE
jgi:hypothetical protein